MMCFSLKRRASFKHQNLQKCSKRSMFWTRKLPNVLFATALYNFWTSGLQKVLRGLQFFRILTLECAFPPQPRAFFQHQNLQKWSKHVMFCTFWHFDFRMCFSPQPRAFFQHQNLQKWSKHVMFCTFWLQNVLFATAACIFFDGWRAKSASELTCFVHFHFKMCFSPQWRAIFDVSSEHLPPHPPL